MDNLERVATFWYFLAPEGNSGFIKAEEIRDALRHLDNEGWLVIDIVVVNEDTAFFDEGGSSVNVTGVFFKASNT